MRVPLYSGLEVRQSGSGVERDDVGVQLIIFHGLIGNWDLAIHVNDPFQGIVFADLGEISILQMLVHMAHNLESHFRNVFLICHRFNGFTGAPLVTNSRLRAFSIMRKFEEQGLTSLAL